MRVKLRANSARARAGNKDIATHFCNWAHSIHHPLDPPKNTFPCIREINCRHSFVGVMESILGRGHSDRQVKHDRLDRLSSLSVTVGEDKRDVYTRDISRTSKVSNKIRTRLGFDRYCYLVGPDNDIRV